MRSLVFSLLLAFPLFTMCQGVFSNNANSALQKVIGDYPNRFRNIQGEAFNEDRETTAYNSKVQIPGSVSTVITKYNSSDKKNVFSWKCLLTESEDFEIASAMYRTLYKQIKNSIVRVDGEKPFILNGTYESPTEDKKFSTCAFYLLPATGEMRKIKVELTLEYYISEWKIALLVYDRDQEEDFQANN